MWTHHAFVSLWYKGRWPACLLLPLSWLFQIIARLHRALYMTGILAVSRLPVPVIIVGNLTVGGAGKTPLVIWLSRYLREQGYHPGIVCRGYGGRLPARPVQVTADSDPAMVGDEAVLLVLRTACPVAVASARAAAARELITHQQCDIILCDDGLQHHALHRDIEIVVIDGDRRFGNGFPLPAGPLRESVKRLSTCDMIVAKERALAHEKRMCYKALALVSLADDRAHSPAALQGRTVHAVAGIANPHRFIDSLQQAGLTVKKHLFPDHHAYQQADFDFVKPGEAVVMTEKDAVKCRRLVLDDAWYVPIEAQLPASFASRLTLLLEERVCG